MSEKPVFYYAPGSPPCSSVLLTAAALNVDLDLRVINLKNGDHLTPDFLKLNPLHTVPILNDNGMVITDSHVICSYLADTYAMDDSLYPKDKSNRMQVNALLFFDCGHLFSRLRIMVEPIIFFAADEISQKKIAYMQRAYDGLEKTLANGREYLCGEEMTIADLCCIASVSAAMQFAPIEEEKFPNLKEWKKRMETLPYYEKNNADNLLVLSNIVQEKLMENQKAKENL